MTGGWDGGDDEGEGGEHLWMVGKGRKDIVDEGGAPQLLTRSLARDVHCSWKRSVVGSFSGGGSRDAPLGDVGWVAPTSVTSRSLPERLIQTLRKGNLPFWL